MQTHSLYLKYLNAPKQIRYYSDSAGTQPQDSVELENGVESVVKIPPTSDSADYTPFAVTIWVQDDPEYKTAHSFSSQYPLGASWVLIPGVTVNSIAIPDTNKGTIEITIENDLENGPKQLSFQVTIEDQDKLFTSKDPQINLEGTN